MTTTTSLYETCQNLFGQYPLAVQIVSHDDAVRSMVLMLKDGAEPAFFILTHQAEDGDDFYHLHSWRGKGITEIESGSEPDAADEAADILTRAVPLPRDGSLFAWCPAGEATALMAIYTQYTPENPVPSWSTLPLEGVQASSWPPFIGERLFGGWFWDHYAAGRIVDVAPLVAGTPGAIFWASPDSLTIGAGCCVVARDVTSPDGWTFPRGAYVYFESLQNGETAGPLDELLAGDVTDLSPRFRKAS